MLWFLNTSNKNFCIHFMYFFFQSFTIKFTRLFFQFKVIYILNKKNLKGNWRQIFPLFLAQYIPLRLKNPKWANKRYIVQNQIFYKFFLTLNRRPFWKRSYTRVTRHTCVRQWKASCQDLKVTTSALLSSCCWNLRAE